MHRLMLNSKIGTIQWLRCGQKSKSFKPYGSRSLDISYQPMVVVAIFPRLFESS